MRSAILPALILALGAAALAQTASVPDATKARAVAPYHPHPTAMRCCREKVWDVTGKEIGDFITYDTRFQSLQLGAYVAHHIKGGDGVPLLVYPTGFFPLQNPGGSSSLFTTPDCSGNAMFAIISSPPLAKRYAMVLTGGSPQASAHAWLFVTDALPLPIVPGPGTVFHSQWGDTGTCTPYPAPGYTVTNPPGGYWTHREEDLLVTYKRPFYIDY